MPGGRSSSLTAYWFEWYTYVGPVGAALISQRCTRSGPLRAFVCTESTHDSAPRDRVPLKTPTIIVLEHLPLFRFPRAERLSLSSEPGAPPHSPSAPGILVTIIEFASGITDCGSSVE